MWLFNVIIAAHLILLATVKCTCTEKSKSVLQDHVLQEIMVISKTNLLYRKFRDTLRILCSKGLIWQEGDTMGLTDSGRLLGGCCLRRVGLIIQTSKHVCRNVF